LDRFHPHRCIALPALLAGLGLLLSASPAAAWCRTSNTTTPTHDGHVCDPLESDDSGVAIFWTKPRMEYSLQQDASTQVPFDTFRKIVRQAFDTWMAVDCGEGHPRIDVLEGPTAVCARHEYNGPETGHGNANIIFFRDAAWDDDPHQFALTTVSFSTVDGTIYDADMALNSALWHFTTTDTGVDVDLQSVVTHEAGHFLGLAHTQPKNADATMFAIYTPGSTALRDLTDDDRAAICAAHPPGPITATCDPTPRHGFSPLCAADQTGPPTAAPNDDCCCGTGYLCADGTCVAEATGCAATPTAPGDAPGPAGAGLVGVTAVLALRIAQRTRRRRRGAQAPGRSPLLY